VQIIWAWVHIISKLFWLVIVLMKNSASCSFGPCFSAYIWLSEKVGKETAQSVFTLGPYWVIAEESGSL